MKLLLALTVKKLMLKVGNIMNCQVSHIGPIQSIMPDYLFASLEKKADSWGFNQYRHGNPNETGAVIGQNLSAAFSSQVAWMGKLSNYGSLCHLECCSYQAGWVIHLVLVSSYFWDRLIPQICIMNYQFNFFLIQER